MFPVGDSRFAVIVGKRLIVSVGQSGTALDKTTGEVLWHSEGEAGYMTPLPLGDSEATTALIASGKFYHEVNLEDGQVRWRHRWLTTFGCNAADPIVRGENIFLSSGYNRGSVLLGAYGDAVEVLWETKEFQNQWSSAPW